MHNNADWVCTKVSETVTRCVHESGQYTDQQQVPGAGVFVLLVAAVLAAFVLWARKK